MTETRDGATDAVLPTLQEVSRVMLDLGAPVTPPRPTAPTARAAFLEVTARKAERLRWRKPPLPRAVRELLRDVVLADRERQATLTPFSEFVPMSVSQRAARILGTTPDAIVARARKVRK